MKIAYLGEASNPVAVIREEGVIISELQDAIDLMADCRYHGANSIIVHESNLPSAFFDLKTRFAGEILQKFSNYRMRLAVVGDFSKYTSKSLRDFIYESNKNKHILFVNSEATALEMLSLLKS